MGRIITSVTIANAFDKEKSIRCDAFVDTGAALMTLPSAWKERLGDLELVQVVDAQLANQQIVKAEIRGPVQIAIEGFRPIYTEVMFLEMQANDGQYDPLVGYLVLEQSQVAVDLVRHKLLPAGAVDLKSINQ
jgi:predicted aspartyl protease